MNRKQITREIIILLASALMFITGISALLVAGFDFLSISLNPQNWGTISDWIIVLITIITAILLLLTLDSQRQVQENQTKLAEIEINRFRKSILPHLFKGSKSLTYHYQKDEDYFIVEYILVFTENVAYNLTIYSDVILEISSNNERLMVIGDENRDEFISKKYKYEFWSMIKPNVGINIRFNLIKTSNEFVRKPSYSTNFSIFYKDESDYQYEQYIFIREKDNFDLSLDYSNVKFL